MALHEKSIPYLTLIWTKDTLKPSSSHFVNNSKAILLAAAEEGSLVPVITQYPFNAKTINVRPTKKWKDVDRVFSFCFFIC